MRGIHVAFSGIDGAGKTTQARRLASVLAGSGTHAIFYEERPDTVPEVARAIARRHSLGHGRAYFGEEAYLLCVSFDILRQRLQHVVPFLGCGITLVTARSAHDWIAGAIVRGCDPATLEKAMEILLFGGRPDIKIWLDTSPEVALRRVMDRGIDTAHLETLLSWRTAFEKLFRAEPHLRIDGDADEVTVAQRVAVAVLDRIANERGNSHGTD